MGAGFSLEFLCEKSGKQIPITSFSTVYWTCSFAIPTRETLWVQYTVSDPMSDLSQYTQFWICQGFASEQSLPLPRYGRHLQLPSQDKACPHPLPAPLLQLSCGQDAFPGRFYNLRLCGPNIVKEFLMSAALKIESNKSSWLHYCPSPWQQSCSLKILVAEIDHWRKGIGSNPPPLRGLTHP